MQSTAMKRKVKSVRGVGEIYTDPKRPVQVGLTCEGKAGLDAIAQSMGISRSELVERIGRGILKVVPAEQESHMSDCA